jgi:hypothetical protein
MAFEESTQHVLAGVHETLAGHCETDGFAEHGVLYVHVCLGYWHKYYVEHFLDSAV